MSARSALANVTRLLAMASVATVAFACQRPEAGAGAAAAAPNSIVLDDGWQLQSSAGLTATGAEISQAGFATRGWTPTPVPTTVLAALVRSGEVRDPYFGKNLDAIPVDRFTVPWWYRREIDAGDLRYPVRRLVFHGINYSAEVWLNGERIAGREQLRGAFRTFSLDVSGRLRPGKNVLAVQVFPPQPGDFTVGFVDWNPKPPDRSMGLWREVELQLSDAVSLDDVFVRSELVHHSLPSKGTDAGLSIGMRAVNHGDAAVTAVLAGTIAPKTGGGGEAISFEHRLELKPRESRDVLLTRTELPQLLVKEPRLWWPNNLGEPHLYGLELSARLGDAGGKLSDREQVEFGIREVTDYVDEKDYRGYRINGKDVLVRGGGWVDDLLLADDDQRLEDQIRYVKHLNLNTIRLEGFWGSTKKLYELADRHGIMVWAGWSCQWEWEPYLGAPVDETFGGIDTPAEIEIVTASWRDQVVRFRNHPSVVVWNLASDMLPRPEVERGYREMLAEIDPTRPPLAACSVRTSEVSGPTGVKMNGPYEWVPPIYWYNDTEKGGAYGFNTETGPGAQPPPLASIQRMLPREHWWPIDDMWAFHSGRGEFDNLDYYTKALEARYGKATGLEDYARKAQLLNYESMRPMFEAFSLRRPEAKGVVQWMLNSAWPDMWWQLYDWYLVPNGAYYATRLANQPLHVAYDLGTRKVVAVNDTAQPVNAVARVRVLDAQSKVLVDERRPVTLAADRRGEVMELPPVAAPVFFLDLRLEGEDGATLARNFYWLPAQPDELDWAKPEWYVTWTRRFADLSALTRLPPAPLQVSHRFTTGGEGNEVEVTLENPGAQLAFFVELAVVGTESGKLAAPIFWDDNYVSLLPGERRVIRGTFPAHALAGEQPAFRYQGINVTAAPAANSGEEVSR